MAFSINEFKTAGLVYGGARPSLFQVTLSNAGSGMAFGGVGQNQIRFMCKGASLPEAMVSPIRVAYFGRNIKVAGDRDFDDWTITIYNDEDFSIRDLFENWSSQINSHEPNLRAAGLAVENYKAEFTVDQFDKEGDIIQTYYMVGAWPTLVAPIDLDWARQNEVELFQVRVAYDYWINPLSDVGGAGVVTAAF